MQLKARRTALWVALIYIGVAIGWDNVSDLLLRAFMTNPRNFIFIDIIKDSSFAVLTGGLLYVILARLIPKLEHEAAQRQKAEILHSESEERYRRVFAVESDAIILLDRVSGQVIEANPAAEKMYGYTQAEFLGLKDIDISAEPEKSRNAISSGVRHVPFRLHRRKDGAVFPVEITCSGLASKNRTQRL